MPKIGTKFQMKIFKKLKQYLAKRDCKYSKYIRSDDSYRFSIAKAGGVRCYVQFISVRATKRPKGSVGVTVSLNKRNENVEEFLSGNGFFGQDKHVFIAPIDYAFRLIDTIPINISSAAKSND